jgi:hypothetical protein
MRFDLLVGLLHKYIYLSPSGRLHIRFLRTSGYHILSVPYNRPKDRTVFLFFFFTLPQKEETVNAVNKQLMGLGKWMRFG